MAEALASIQTITTEINILLRNFKKDQQKWKTEKYLKQKVERIQALYEKVSKLEKIEDSLVKSAAENFKKTYRIFRGELDKCVPVVRTTRLSKKSKSTEELNNLPVPESIDTVKGKLHETLNKYSQLSENVEELISRYTTELQTIENLDGFDSEIEKLEFIIEQSSVTRQILEEKFLQEKDLACAAIQTKNKRIKDLEELLVSADDKLEDISNQEKIYIDNIKKLKQVNEQILQKNANVTEDLEDSEKKIIELKQKISCADKEKLILQEQLGEIKIRLDDEISEDERENYKHLIENLNAEIAQLNEQNTALQNLWGNTAETSYRVDERETEAMDEYDKIIKTIKDAIPVFDGGRAATAAADVKQFIRCCELVHSKLSAADKLIFMEVIGIKFKGDAADLVNSSGWSTMEQLKNILLRAYVPKRSFQSLMDEMKRGIQRPGEELPSFGLRMTKLLQYCVNEAKKEYSEGNEALLKSIEKDAVKAYKMGIGNTAIKYHLMAIKAEKLAKIIEIAEGIADEGDFGLEGLSLYDQAQNKTALNTMDDRKQNETQGQQNRGYQGSPNNGSGGYGGYGNRNRGNSGGDNGNDKGQRNNTTNGPSDSGNNFRRNFENNGNQNRPRNREAGKCFRCNREGHFQSDCRTRPENCFCTKCNRYGHQSRYCQVVVAVVEQQNSIRCRFCQRDNHTIESCVFKKDYERDLALAQGNETGSLIGTLRPQ